MSNQSALDNISSASSGSNDSNVPHDVNKVESTEPKFLNLLCSHQKIKIKEQFILKISKDYKIVSMEVKNICKIIYFTLEWSFEEMLNTIDKLDPKEYQQLFIFIVDASNFAKTAEFLSNCTKIQEKLLKFGYTRPLVLQLSSVNENATNLIYYKLEDSFQFIDTAQPNSTTSFPAFLNSFYGGQYDDSEIEVLYAVVELENCPLLLRFLQTLELSNAIFGNLLLNLAEDCSKSEFIAALDAPFINEGRILSDRAQRNISLEFGDKIDSQNYDSVLLKAVQYENSEIIDYLITYWSHLIQQLSFEHQIKISTDAYQTNQLDVLCDLLDISDFPFPKEFKTKDIKHERLERIIAERTAFIAAIQTDNFTGINDFINNNLSKKFIYSLSNVSALNEAINMKKFAVFYYLKSFGLKGQKFEEILQELSENDRQQATKLATEQRMLNVQNSQFIAPKSVMFLSMKSSIHNSRTSKTQQIKYREKIIKWLEDIHKVAAELIDAAASCEELRMIFDFESISVENVTLIDTDALGTTFPQTKSIFIGAKLTDSDNKQREQEIKGVLAHELCHYVMKLVYENEENPYYKIMVKIAEIFEAIVRVINRWSAGGINEPDDECNGTISTVFTLYPVEDFHPELIVRVVQILTEFDDNEDKSRILQDKYKILFDFWENYVIPDLRTFNLKSRNSVRKMNRMLELLKSLRCKLCPINSQKNIKTLFNHELTVVITNVPTLLIFDIFCYLKDTVGDLFDTENVFVDPRVLKNEEISKDFKKLLQDIPKLNVIVNCFSGITKNVIDFRGSRTIFVVSNEAQYQELIKALSEFESLLTKTDINYNWNELTKENQELLMNTKVNFQNRTKLTLLSFFMADNSTKENRFSDAYEKAKISVLNDFSEVIDDELLNFLVNGCNISINMPNENVDSQEEAKLLYIKRDFYKKNQGSMQKADQKVQNISQDQLFNEVKGKPVVLISDIAGNGKSWTMKNFADIFKQDKSFKWVTFVDLKQFIDEFKAQMVQNSEFEFGAFIAEKILKPRHKFEAKIFQKLYKIGKVLIFFDGFDEIAPDCAVFISKLAQKFQQNSGNQLWIATRDYFEISLQNKLSTDAVYGITMLSFSDAVNLIAKKWENDNMESDSNEKFENYQQKASKIVRQFDCNWNFTVGMPLLLKLIAEVFLTDKDCSNINMTMIFKKYIQKLNKIWSHEKGKIREEASIECQELEYSFWQIHHYWAIATLHPELSEILFPDYDPSEWPEVEIVACGLINKIGENVYFVHETYREYFVADYLAKAMKKSKIADGVMKIFTRVLEVRKFGVIRRFLNGLVDDLSNLKKVRNFNQIFNEKMINLSFVRLFTENLDILANFFIQILKTRSHDEKLKIIKKNITNIATWLPDSNINEMFQELIFETPDVEELKDLIIQQGIFQGIINSDLNFIECENFIKKVELKTDRGFIKEALKLRTKSIVWVGNFLYHSCQFDKFSLERFQKSLKICQRFLEFNEICELIRDCNGRGTSFLSMVYAWSFHNFCQIWQEIESFYKTHDASNQFKELVKHIDWEENTVLTEGAFQDDVNLHKNLWQVMMHTFEDKEELKEFITKNNKSSFIHKVIARNTNLEVVKLMFDVLKQNFTDAQFIETFKLTSTDHFNLLLTASSHSKVIEIHKFLWTFFKSFCQSDEEFLKMVQEVDDLQKNILELCVCLSSNEIFEFMIEELEKLTTHNEIRNMLSHMSQSRMNLLQTSTLSNESLVLHKSVWEVFRKYFKASEIVNFIKNIDNEFGENLLFYAFYQRDMEIIEFTWNEIKKYLSQDEQIQYLKIKNNDSKNLLERTATFARPFEDISKEKIEWIIKIFKEYNIDFTDKQLPNWYLQESAE